MYGDGYVNEKYDENIQTKYFDDDDIDYDDDASKIWNTKNFLLFSCFLFVNWIVCWVGVQWL